MRRPFLSVLVCLAVGAAACGGGSTPGPTTPTGPPPVANRPPTINSMTVSPNFGIAGITQFNYSSSATDPDGDALTYAWEFADAGTATGAAVVPQLRERKGTGSVSSRSATAEAGR